jgi:hypothetical protein
MNKLCNIRVIKHIRKVKQVYDIHAYADGQVSTVAWMGYYRFGQYTVVVFSYDTTVR